MEVRTLPKPDRRPRDRVSATPYLFLALEAGRAVEGSARWKLGDVDLVRIGRGSHRAASRAIEHGVRVLRIELPDPWMSQEHARIARRAGECALSDAGSRNGSLVNDVPVTIATLRDGDVVELGGSFFVFRAGLPELDEADVLTTAPEPSQRATPSREALGTVTPQLIERLGEVVRVAATRVSILVHGASGSGKEVLARTVHAWSGRKGAFVAVNCGGLPATLVESELFGYQRGAFSGASADKVGLIAAADGGTLFLDEIGDLPAAIQPVILRALQERAIVPVGATAPVPVDFRLISATHRDLASLVEQSTFREDLWARLAGFTIELPDLESRREDLATLIADLAERHLPGHRVELTADAARAILRYPWPRNIRELEKTLTAAIALAGDGPIDLPHLPAEIATAAAVGEGRHVAETSSDDLAVDPRRDELVAALAAHDGNISAAARALGRPRSQIQRWMRRWGIRATGAD